MKHSDIQLLGLIAAVVGSLLYAIFKRAEGKPTLTTKERAELALGELQKWGTFLVGLQTAAIGVMGFLFENVTSSGKTLLLSPWQFTCGVLALICFGSSILAATWLLGAIPSLHLRIGDKECTENDVFHLSLFKKLSWPVVGPMTGLQYVLFSIGVVFFAVFVYMRVPTAS